ncbi:helix-turn-helix domain-containing protein [Vibrio parahaemolyticus]|uniref:helix-turn-helix domain-containing protein n=1 Tax=Vibrio parahaemolyticus TaxID=670 RepID=UPI0028676804|nr:ImmA/IrrE family metallo-endopeptidase [Vibrio alginolyticus]ELE1940135.1 ImmA/IrrE family metallo-endopeptidase [Vibrio cholerae]ELJ8709682.1 ImmA/IrrE family metallo-endopeptidase [Vibrio cholerae]
MIYQAVNRFNGEQLKLARVAAGLSLADVGEALQVTRQYASRLENNASPSDAQIELLSSLLSVNTSFFFRPRAKTIEAEQCHFRSLRSSTQTLKKTIMAQVEMLDSHFVSAIEDEVGFPEVSIFSAEDHEFRSVKDIELLAERARKEFGLGLGPISNMIKLLEKLGCIVVNLADADERIDAFSIYTSRPLIVRNTTKQSPGRLRFDFAHELGHLIMHQGIETGCRTTEQQANNFASAFLMPRSSFVAEFPRVRGSYFNWDALVEMKVRWGVSLKAILYRAKALGLITSDKAKSGYIYLSRNGFAKVERGDELMNIEHPMMLQRAIELLDIHTLENLIANSGLSRQLLKERYSLMLPLPPLRSV